MTARNTTPANTIKDNCCYSNFSNNQLWRNSGIIRGTFGADSGKSINKLSPNWKLRQKGRRLNKIKLKKACFHSFQPVQSEHGPTEAEKTVARQKFESHWVFIFLSDPLLIVKVSVNPKTMRPVFHKTFLVHSSYSPSLLA